MYKSIEHLMGRLNLIDVVLPDLGIEVVSVRGNEITVRCPDWLGLHSNGDRTPSMGINEDNLLGQCYVCGGFSISQLVAQTLGLSDEDSVTWLEEHSDLAPSSTEDFRNEIERILAKHVEKLEPLPDYPPDLLFQYEGFHPWLSDRGITREVATEMQIGFDPTHCGIVIPVFFKHRLVGMQTRHLGQDRNGNYICPQRCFQQKVLPELRGTNVPKYKNSSRFPASQVLYNYDNAVSRTTTGECKVIVVESPMSVLYMMSQGIRNVVSTFGSGISALQGQLLYPFVDGVLVWPDNDGAGNKTIRDALKILGEYIPLSLVPVVPGEKSDPGDVPPEQLQAYIQAAYPAAVYQMEGLKHGLQEVHHE